MAFPCGPYGEANEVSAAGYFSACVVCTVPGNGVEACGLIIVCKRPYLPTGKAVNGDMYVATLRKLVFDESSHIEWIWSTLRDKQSSSG